MQFFLTNIQELAEKQISEKNMQNSIKKQVKF